jgi:hypothetical protein
VFFIRFCQQLHEYNLTCTPQHNILDLETSSTSLYVQIYTGLNPCERHPAKRSILSSYRRRCCFDEVARIGSGRHGLESTVSNSKRMRSVRCTYLFAPLGGRASCPPLLLPPFSGGEIQHICQLGDFFEMSFQTKITFLILQAIKKTSYRSHALIFMYFYVLRPNQTFFTS